MDNPYKILGVAEDASVDEIKENYRILAASYSKRSGNAEPDGSLARGQMRELNLAYDAIMLQRRKIIDYDEAYARIRDEINHGNFGSAEAQLSAIRPEIMTAEWSFLMGSIYYAKGWLGEAYKFFEAAVNLDRKNPEYNAAFSGLRENRSAPKTGGGDGTPPSKDKHHGLCDMISPLFRQKKLQISL